MSTPASNLPKMSEVGRWITVSMPGLIGPFHSSQQCVSYAFVLFRKATGSGMTMGAFKEQLASAGYVPECRMAPSANGHDRETRFVLALPSREEWLR